VTFDVHESERPQAPTVLLSAGLGGAAGYWTPQLASLTARYRVITYDQRGTGRTRAAQLPTGYAISDMADEVVEILDATATQACHFVGHALGGLAGVDLAVRHPERVRSLTLVNGWATADAHTRRCFEIRVALLKGAGPEAYVRAQPIFLYPAIWLAAHAERMEAEDTHALSGFQGSNNLLRRIEALLQFDATPHLDALRLPVLVSAARDDVLVSSSQSETLAAHLPTATLDVAPYGGHGLNVTEPAAFNSLLRGFLDRQP